MLPFDRKSPPSAKGAEDGTLKYIETCWLIE